jgi:hypothetical protein
MPASTKKVTRRAASLERGIAKNVAKNVAKRAAKAKPAAKGRKAPKLLVDLMNKPFRDARNAKRAPVTALGAIRQEIAEKADAKTFAGKLVPVRARLARPAKAEKPAPVADAKAEKPAATGAKAKIVAMIAAEGGTSAAEVCKALGWARAGATIGRAIKLAGFKVAKVRDADGVLRYSRA